MSDQELEDIEEIVEAEELSCTVCSATFQSDWEDTEDVCGYCLHRISLEEAEVEGSGSRLQKVQEVRPNRVLFYSEDI
jgi:DNA-directed RNA polymerase subunit RPC12/RpoP